ncbi:MAG: NAD(P)-dependent oxidoreductase, partial [Cyanobacteria bacterium P01_H01_bin.121]
VDQAIQELCQYYQQRIYLRLPLRLWLAEILIRVFRIQVATWDRFCLQYRHFTHQNPINPALLNLEPQAPTLTELLQISGIPRPT